MNKIKVFTLLTTIFFLFSCVNTQTEKERQELFNIKYDYATTVQELIIDYLSGELPTKPTSKIGNQLVKKNREMIDWFKEMEKNIDFQDKKMMKNMYITKKISIYSIFLQNDIDIDNWLNKGI